MLIRTEYVLLKYIKNHRNITHTQLTTKFQKQDVNSILAPLNPYISKYNKEEIFDEFGDSTGEYDTNDDTYYLCNRLGLVEIEIWYKENIRWKVPIIISIIALLFSITNTIIDLVI